MLIILGRIVCHNNNKMGIMAVGHLPDTIVILELLSLSVLYAPKYLGISILMRNIGSLWRQLWRTGSTGS